jgi:hypothetical protein
MMVGQTILTTTSEFPGSQAVSNSVVGRTRNSFHCIFGLHRFHVDFVDRLGGAGLPERLVGLIRVPAIEDEFGEGAEQQPDTLLCEPRSNDRHGYRPAGAAELGVAGLAASIATACACATAGSFGSMSMIRCWMDAGVMPKNASASGMALSALLAASASAWLWT